MKEAFPPLKCIPPYESLLLDSRTLKDVLGWNEQCGHPILWLIIGRKSEMGCPYRDLLFYTRQFKNFR